MLNKAILTTSTTICTILATTAQAQRSVALHGTVDTGIAYILHSAGQHSQWKMSPGTLSSNEWGLQGNKELVGGLAAHFSVENSFDIGHGQSISRGQMFGSKAFVGLSNPDTSSGFSNAQKYGNGSVFALWQGLTSLQALVGYNYTRSSGASSAVYQQVNVGVDYLLSKRTDVYAMLGYQHACGQNGLGPAQTVIGSYNVEAGANSQLLTIAGIRHRF